MAATSSMDTSLLLTFLDRGAGENLRTIFKHLSSLKDKIRIERVCRTFRKYANSYEVWANVTTIIIKDANSRYQINGEQVPIDQVASAVNSVLSRCHNIQLIDLYHCKSPIVYSLVAECIQNLGTISFRKLQQLKFSVRNSCDTSSCITRIIDALNNRLTTLDLSIVNYLELDDLIRLWKSIGKCTKLKQFVYSAFSHNADVRIKDLMKMTLCNKPIEYLHLKTFNGIDSNDLIEIITSRSQQKSMKYFATNSEQIMLIDFFHKIPDMHWIGLQEFTYSFPFNIGNESQFYAGPNWATAKDLPQLLPKLSRLTLHGNFDNINQTVDLIISYISILNKNQKSQRCLVLHLDFILVLRPGGWETVFLPLLHDYQCEIKHLPGRVFRIHRKQQGNGFIEIINDYWQALRSNS